MRTDWSRVRVWIALLAALPLSGVTRAEKTAPLRDTKRVIVASPPNAIEEAPAPTLIFGTTTDATGGVAATTDCDAIGGWSLVPPLTGANRFRGNQYSVDHSVKLIEYASELAITNGAVANLEFVVYEYDDFNSNWMQIHEKTTSVTGDGQRAFYSTGQLNPPVQLSANHKYVIGVAWTNTTIIYNTDSENYPRNFAVGTVDGRVALNNPSSPMPDPVGLFTVNPAGVYSMQLCFTGACCLPNDQCADLTETECLLQQGQFSASGVGCLQVGVCPMVRGACCQPTGSCSYINEYKCGTLAGAWTDGVRCDDPSEPCAPRGGCCLDHALPDGTWCIPDQTVTQCALQDGGTYRGDNVTCDDFPPCTAGACCDRITNDCTLEVTESDCVASGGSFAGPGTRCVDDPCSVKGACCTGTTCQEVTAAACDGLSGTYRGDFTTCDALDVACGRGACCVPGVGCRVLTEAGCTTFGGTFNGEGITCENLSPGCPGTCCAFGSVCATDVTPELCVESEGVFLGYDAGCANPNTDPPVPDPCASLVPADASACCLGNTGTCVDYFDTGARNACDDLGGSQQANMPCAAAAPCPVYEPTGACCQRGILACSDGLTEADCTVLDPTAQWTQGVLCSNLYPICEPLGACCNRDALTCVDSRTEAECADEWNIGQTCNQVACAPTGACCNPADQSCSDVTAYNCEQMGYAFSGEGTACTDADACRRGACCHRDGSCEDGLLTEDCIAGPGEPDPDFHIGQLCNDVCFPRGACCSGSDCVIATRAACGNDLNYRGDGSDCEPDLCTAAACCSPDGMFCADQTKLICDQSGWTYHPGEMCVGQECPPPVGACCTTVDGSPTCVPMTEADCANALGYYAGDNIECSVALCNSAFGACCDPSGAEPCRMLTVDECDDVSGYFAGAGTSSCSDDGVCGLGACCNLSETTCVMSNLANCEPGGVFRGVGSACLGVTCPPPTGACCIIDPQQGEDACMEIFESDCLAGGNFYAGDATSCGTGGICELGACCQRDGMCVDNINTDTCIPDPLGAPPPVFRTGGGGCATFCAPRGACCHDTVCTVEGKLQCEDGGGTYSGDGTDCVEGTCVTGACCQINPDTQAPQCAILTRQQCEDVADVPGIYSGAGTDCNGGPDQCNRGTCCPPEGQSACFDNTVAARCADPGAFPSSGIFTELNGDFIEGKTCTDCVGRGACCLPSGACEVRTGFACTSGGGDYSGNNTDCSDPALCQDGGCCLSNGSCQIETLQGCTFLGGAYQGLQSDCSAPCLGACCDAVTGDCTDVAVGDCTGTWTANTTCAELDPPCPVTRGACCDAGTCVEDAREIDCGGVWVPNTSCAELIPPCPRLGACCTMDGCADNTKELDCTGSWTADTTCAELNPPCPKYGACCTDATCSIETEADCVAGGGAYGGNDTVCDADLCTVGACCLPDNSCQDVTLLACNGTTDGVYQGPGTACVAGQCPSGCEQGIEASSPENCAIDARYPTNPNDAGIVFGWDSFNLTVACDATTLTAGDFSIRVVPNDVAAPAITNVAGSGLSVTITLDGPIPAGHWTCVKHLASGTEVCLGFLPGDVDASRATTASDILEVLDFLNGNITLETYQCDVDRSAVCNATDVLGVIDLLNGAGAFDVWNNVSLPVCPTAP